MNELEALAILSSMSGMGAVRIRFLMERYGSAQTALLAPSSEIQNLRGFEKIAFHWTKWQKENTWQKDLDLALENGVAVIPYTHPQFPRRLLEISDHPIMIYVLGEIKPQDQRCIAVIGTRNAGIYGNEMARIISQDLAANGFTVVSGLARGIDTSAHSGAIKTGRTFAVIGSGLSAIYPVENIPLARAISQKGALISEFPMTTPPERQNFPQRNRIVSGMTLATLLIEAPIKSGAMITMEKGWLQKRKLFALPGRADTENFRGNHDLIKKGQALLVENAQDIIIHFENLFGPMTVRPSNEKQLIVLNPDETALLNLMPDEELHIDDLSGRVAIPIQRIQQLLMSLVIKKAVKEYPGKLYKKQRL